MKKQSDLLRLFKDYRRYWPGLIYLLFLMLLSGVFKALAAYFFGKAIDFGTLGLFTPVIHFILLTGAMYLLDAARLALFNIETARVIERMFLEIKRRAFHAVASSRLAEYEQTLRGGDLLMRISHDLSQLGKRIAESFTWVISVFFRGGIALAVCLTVSWRLSLVYLLLIPALLAVTDRISRPIRQYTKQAADNHGRAAAIMTEMLDNNAVIKSFSAESAQERRFEREVEEQRHKRNLSARKNMLLSLTAYLAEVLLMAVLFLYGGYLIFNENLSVGAFVTFITLSGSIREAISLSETGMRYVRDAQALAGRVYEVLDFPQEASRVNVPQPGSAEKAFPNGVAAVELGFSYDSSQRVLADINLYVPAGRWTALIGPSGCGKSTLLKLLSGLYENYSGELYLFGRSAKDPECRKRIALVSQDPYLFPGTILQNVRYGNPDADEQKVKKALMDARLWDFVASLPEGMHTDIGDGGSRLSGGQRQRLAIARALIRDADLILMDEATSALDVATERELQDTIATAFAGKTVIAAAHRFASIESFDYVCCMEAGHIVESGFMCELMNQDSALKRMADAQRGGGANGE